MAREMTKRGPTRRQLLIGGGAGVGLLVAWKFWPRSYAPNLRAREGETVYNAWLKIGRDGHVSVAVPQAELGQGVYSALPQILADELGADWRTVAVEPAPLSPLYANTFLATQAADDSGWPSGLQGTGRWLSRRYATQNALMLTAGSSSVRAFEAPLREAGAAARVMLCMAAAARWGANWEELDAREGFVWRGTDRIPFAELAESAISETPPDPVPLRDNADNRLAGQPLPRLDAPAKVDGSALFAGDVRFPDMVYAALVSGPWGARFAGMDKAAASRVPGALRLFENPEWAAVVASNWWAAHKALTAMQPRFHLRTPFVTGQSIQAALGTALDGEGARVFEAGDIAGPFPGASPVTQTYEVGLAPAAALEPLTATVRIIGDVLEVYAGCQAPGLARAAAARGAGMAERQVTIFQTFAGGGYGRKLELMAIEQAAHLAKQMSRPVQLTWSRMQEIQRDSYRPAARARMTGWMKQGRLEAWQAKIAAPATSVEVARRIGASGGMARPAFAAVAGARPPYAIPNFAVDHAEVGDRHRDRPVARRGAQLHLLFHRMLRRRAGDRRRAGAARLPHLPPPEQPAARGMPRHRRLDRRLGRRRAGERDGPGLPQRVRFAHRLPGRGRGDGGPEAARHPGGGGGGLRPGGQSGAGQAADRGRHRPWRRGGYGQAGRIRGRHAGGADDRRLRPAHPARRAGGQRRADRERRGAGRDHRARRAAGGAGHRQRLLFADRAEGAEPADRGRHPGSGGAGMTRPTDHPELPAPKIGVLLVNLGTPDAPEPGAVKRYLREFLSDRRVVEIPPLVWQPILRGIILNTRPKKSAHAYSQVWMEEGSPLAVYHAAAGGSAAGGVRAGGDRRLRDALRQSGHCRAARRAAGAGLHAHPGGAALPAILRRDDGDGGGRGLPAPGAAALAAGGADPAALS